MLDSRKIFAIIRKSSQKIETYRLDLTDFTFDITDGNIFVFGQVPQLEVNRTFEAPFNYIGLAKEAQAAENKKHTVMALALEQNIDEEEISKKVCNYYLQAYAEQQMKKRTPNYLEPPENFHLN